MVGIDTNILVRYFSEDDERQASRAVAFTQSLSVENPGFIPLVALAEMVWVLRSRYATAKAQIVEIIGLLLRTPEFVVENAETAKAALARFVETTAEFSDCLIERAAHHAGCTHTMTFDQRAAKMPGMRLVP